MTASPSIQPETSAVQNGRLHGLTILRFAHTCGEGGGLERYLLDLNRALGQRNQFTGLQLELSYDRNQLAEQTSVHDGCRLTKIPLFTKPATTSAQAHELRKDKLKSWLVNNVLCQSPVYELFTRGYINRRRVPRQPDEPEGAGQKAGELIEQFKVDLVVVHSAGGADVSEIIEVARAKKIPVALVHHFSNDRLAGLSLRQQISRVNGVGGVCGVEVPPFLRENFCNLSDGIDTEFYRRENAVPVKRAHPILFLPARITPSKGQADLLKIAANLKQRGIRTTVVFAGRVDSAAFETELRELAKTAGLTEDVEFIGQLDPKQLRDWYAAASAMVFPTYHHEGLGRVSVEAQAMGLPPIVYEIGGTPEGLRDGQTGFLIPLGDIQRMTDAVETLLTNNSLHKKMSKAGRKFVEEKFSLCALAARHEEFCLKILSAGRNSLSVQ